MPFYHRPHTNFISQSISVEVRRVPQIRSQSPDKSPSTPVQCLRRVLPAKVGDMMSQLHFKVSLPKGPGPQPFRRCVSIVSLGTGWLQKFNHARPLLMMGLDDRSGNSWYIHSSDSCNKTSSLSTNQNLLNPQDTPTCPHLKAFVLSTPHHDPLSADRRSSTRSSALWPLDRSEVPMARIERGAEPHRRP